VVCEADAVDAAEAKIVLLPPKKQALPSATDQATAGRAGVCLPICLSRRAAIWRRATSDYG
jgi:hypothetical protein